MTYEVYDNNIRGNTNLRDIYALKAISQIPRLLSLQDRNPFSPTYGCFDRTFWLYKAIDFPNAVTQYAVQSLALVYRYEFPRNIYYGSSQILDWCIAGMDYWAKIQHNDGSVDEFYPFERGWAGPTGETLYAVLSAYELLKDDIPKNVAEQILNSAYKAAKYVAKYSQSGGILANHHAMAILALRKAYEVFGEKEFIQGFKNKWHDFLKYHTDEGWSLEYDGADPGYLSATVSSLAKVYQMAPTEELFNVLRSAVEFASYFVYPDKSYAGSLGSRHTFHFYSHGFEILSQAIPLAGAIAQKLLEGLAEGKLVPPEIMPDRYIVYRIPEYLLSYLDCKPRLDNLPKLPYENSSFRRYFSAAKIFVSKELNHYCLVNLAKGGVIKIFECEHGRLIYNDCGIIGRLDNGTVVSSQWLDEKYLISIEGNELKIEGNLNKMPSAKCFTPFRLIIFRLILLIAGWSTKFSHLIKGTIRKVLMVGNRPTPIQFQRIIRIAQDEFTITDRINIASNIKLESLAVGGEFAVRYVPQSRYFQTQELNAKGFHLDNEVLSKLNSQRQITINRNIDLTDDSIRFEIEYDGGIS